MTLPAEVRPASDLALVGGVLRRRWKIIVLAIVLAVVVAGAFTLSQTKRYTASASLLFRTTNVAGALFGTNLGDVQPDPTREAATNLQLVSLPVVADRVARRLNVRGLSGDGVWSEVKTAARNESDVVSIAATDPDPELATRIANTFATEFIAFRRTADRARIADAQGLVRRELAALPSGQLNAGQRDLQRQLTRRLQDLRVLSALQTSNAEFVQPASVPKHPSSPHRARNIVLGALAGLLLGLALALLHEQIDRRISAPEDLSKAFGLPMLATVPRSRMLSRASMASTRGPEFDAFRRLYANIRFATLGAPPRSLVVTSGAPGEGKTTVALNLAAAATEAGQRVLLVDGDLRRPMIAARLGITGALGITDLLRAPTLSLDEVVVADVVVAHAPDDASDARRVDVLAADSGEPNPAQLLSLPRLVEVLRSAEARYDVVIIDSSPINVVADALQLIDAADEVLVVGRMNVTLTQTATAVQRQLQHVGAHTVGLVVNGSESAESEYSYAYTGRAS